MHKFNRLAASLLALGVAGSFLPTPAAAQVLFFQDFENATVGQTLADSPLNWTLFAGAPFVGVTANVHPGWPGNAIAMQNPNGEGYYRHAISLPSSGVVEWSFKCWAYGFQGSGQVHLDNGDNGPNRIIISNNSTKFYIYSNGQEYEFGEAYFDATSYLHIFIDLSGRSVRVVTTNDAGDVERTSTYSVISTFLGTAINVGEFHHGFDIDNLKVQALPPPLQKTISGVVTLADFGADVAGQQVAVEINDFYSQSPEQQTVTLASDGSFSLTTMRQGDANVTFKGAHWLGRRVPNIEIPTNGLSDLNVTLINGDCDDDNEITLVDVGILAASFGKALGDAGFDTRADLDGDDEVTLVDFGILSAHFGESGD